ncbi:MAG TPA: sigma-70 family RNA polymerase sigma factor [Rectinemataceae bacterium]|nr:sigma-70 family RNA polymerase sigma factor [Rectinemataceae bacterium]
MLDVEALYRKYGPMVLRRCRRLLGDEEKALDAMQECFVRVLRSKERLHGDGVSSLLYCVATNVCLNLLRSERGDPALRDERLLMAIAAREDEEKLGLARGLLERIFSREQASTRSIAVLHYVDGMTLEETAAAVGLSVSGVRKRLAALRSRAEASGEEWP